MIVCIGEILIDAIETINNNVKSREIHCGGAPFNVAYNALNTNAQVAFIGAVGKDENGRFLINFAHQHPFTYLNIQEIDKPTTVAQVNNDETGERYFRFIRSDTADYQIDFDMIDKKVLKNASIIHLGSLMLSEEKGRNTADKIIKYAKENNKLLSFDVNFRTDIFKNIKEAKSIYEKYIKGADILKLSADELTIFTNSQNFNKAVEEIIRPNMLLIITLGSKGSYYRYNDDFAFTNSVSVKPIDTTGAGDAFYGTFLGLLDNDLDFKNKDKMIEILTYSNKVGALTTLFKGAIK